MLTLAISGFNADPDLVSQTLGFEPTSIGRVGEPSRSGRPRTFNGWWYEAEPQRLTDGAQHDDALTRILAQLKGREDRFALLKTTIQPRLTTIYGGLYVSSDQQSGVWLHPDQMQLLVACGIDWGIDIFVDE